MRSMWMKKAIAVAAALVGLSIGIPAGFSMAAFTGLGSVSPTLSANDYTWNPAFLNAKVDPNVIIMLDFGGAMLNAAYGNYPESRITSPACALNSSITCPQSISGNVGGPTVTFSGGTSATGATATATIGGGGVATIRLTAGGSGYLTPPTVSFSGGGGSGAVATATVDPVSGAVTDLAITTSGSGYTSAPTVSFSGSGSGAAATTTIGGSVTAITVTNGGSGYTGGAPSVVISGGGGGGAAATATISGGAVTGVTISTGGGGYTSPPTVTFNPNATGFVSTVTAGTIPLGTSSITMVTGGSGYTSNPTVTITGGSFGGSTVGSGATATATFVSGSLTFSVTNAGSGYNSAPLVTLGGGGGGTCATVLATVPGGSNKTVTAVTGTGCTGFTSTPTVSFSSGAATAVASVVTLVTPTVTATGSGYASPNLCDTNAGYVVSGTQVSPPVGCTYIGVIAGRDDQFDPTVSYYGMFNTMECLAAVSQSGGQFAPPSPNNKAALDSTCPSTAPWDGNFLNWVGMRQLDLSRQIAYGGRTQGAGSHGATSGNVNTLQTEDATGDSGTNATPDPFTGNQCASATCDYRYVKAAPTSNMSGVRYPSTYPDGALFGVELGNIYPCVCKVGGTTAGTYPSEATVFASSSLPLQFDVSNNAEAVSGLIQNLPSTGIRTSIWFVNASSGNAASILNAFDGFGVGSGCGNTPNCMNAIRTTAIGAWSPLAESTYEALCYYRLVKAGSTNLSACYNSSSTADFTPANNTGSITPAYLAAGDPFFFQANNQAVACCKSFLLMISAGKPSKDGNPPTQNALPNFSEFQTLQPNDFIPTASTVWPPPTSQTTPPGWLERIANYGLMNDLRPDIGNVQNVKFYSVVLTGPSGDPTGGYKMASAALWGGFQDQNNDGIPQMNGQGCTFPHTASNKPATVLMPVSLFNANPATPANWTSTSSPEWDANRDCLPDNYFEAGDAGGLTAAINNALAAIRKEAASGTSVSVLATSSTGEGTLYQAFFFPVQFEGQNQIQWLGYTQGLWVDEFGNIRQDFSAANCTGPPDGRLVLEHDCIIKTRFDPSTGNVFVDVFVDANGDGLADSTTPTKTVTLQTIQPVWEAGARLAYTAPGTSCTTANAGTSSCRRILTWLDNTGGARNNVVDSGEVIEFNASNVASLCPYLAASHVGDCTSATASAKTAALNEATDLVNFHRGFDGTSSTDMNTPNLRNRTITTVNPDNPVASAQKTWKLGDVIDSTPTIVAAPKERFDTIYGDGTYAAFFAQYQHRREVAYVGANDGMLHAFNGGFYTKGDAPSTVFGDALTEHGFLSKSPSSAFGTTTRATPPLGAELWGFIPQELLPHLQWYASTTYAHTAYMDLKPKVTDVRIFCGDSTAAPNGSPTPCVNGQTGTSGSYTPGTTTPGPTHPGGWGTILIAGMKFGGSCGACPAGSGRAMTVNADFKGNATSADAGNTRSFYSSYYIFDITDPEQDPVLLWVVTDAALGFTTSYPAVVRVSPLGNGKTDPSGAKWVAVFGSGPTGYDARSTQTAKFYTVDLTLGPSYVSAPFVAAIAITSGGTSAFSSAPTVVIGCISANNPSGCSSGGGSGATATATINGAGVVTAITITAAGSGYTSVPTVSFINPGGGCSQGCGATATASTGVLTGTTVYSTGDANSFMGDIISLDANLDYRVDVIYAGNIICNSATVSPCSGGNPVWKGKMYRLTTGGVRSGSPDPTDLTKWGITSGAVQVPTALLATFSCTSSGTPPTCLATSATTPIGPVTAAVTVSSDNNNNIWVFFGTGRYFSTSGSPNDKGITTDLQYFFGVKDPLANSTQCTATTNETTDPTHCQKNNVIDVSGIVVCISNCGAQAQVTGGVGAAASATTLDSGSTSLQGVIQNADGWFTNLPQITTTTNATVTAGPNAPSGQTVATRERVLSAPTILGGTVFFTSFVPINDLCASAGTGTLYALYYTTGSAYKQSTIGTSTSGAATISSRTATLGLGLPSQLSVQIGGQGTGAAGSTSSSGCASRVTGFYQASTGVLGQACGTPALSVWSRIVSWRDL